MSGLTNIVPKMGLDQLREGYRWLLKQLYSPKLYYERVRTLLRRERRDRDKTDSSDQADTD